MNRAIAWFADNHVAANLLMLFFVAAGIMTAFNIKVEVFPEFSLDKVQVEMEYPGASPSEIEETILRRIEERVASVAGIRRIDSAAREGFGSVTIEVQSGWDLQKLLDEVKAEVDRIDTFPEEAEKPVVREVTRRTQVVWVALFGDVPEATLKHLAEELQDDLTDIPGITLAELFGVREGEIHVEISEETLRRHGLTLAQVAQKVGESSLDLPAGRIKTDAGDVLVRTKGRRYQARNYSDIAVITKPDGTKLTLGQIAQLRDGFEDTDLFARFQGKPASLVQVYRVADQNALEVAAKAKAYVEEYRRRLPAGVDVEFFGDRSVVLKSRLDLLLRNLAMGLVLVAVVLGLFLELRLAFWVTVGIPVSFLIGLTILPQVGVSINMISLFAFILVLGIVVDDAIVVGENVFKKREAGMPPLKAAIEGAQEVGGPVVFSVLTTVVAFAPLLAGTGTMGKIMQNIPWVVILVLIGSLLESLFVLPSHLAHAKIKPTLQANGSHKEKITARWLRSFIDGPYTRVLDFCLRWRYATLAAGLAVLLLALGTFTSGMIKFTLFPRVESDVLIATLTMPAGTSVQQTAQVVARLEKAADEAMAELDKEDGIPGKPLLQHTVSLVGLQAGGGGPHGAAPEMGSHVATLFVQLLEGEERTVSAERAMNAWRAKVGLVPEAQSLTYQSEIFSPGNPVEVHLSSPDDAGLLAAVEELKSELRTFPGVFDVADSFVPGKNELQLKLKPSAQPLGITLMDLSRQVRNAFYGAEALRLVRDKDEIKVMVRYPEASRKSLGDIERMRIRTAGGFEVPFSQVAEVTMVQGYSTIQRAQRKRVVKVTADVDEKVTNASEVRARISGEIMPRIKGRHPGLRYDMEGAAREQKESLTDIAQGFAIALFGIYILLAIPFKSFTQPLIVMMAIPFGMVGAVAGHLLMGLNLSLLSLFGIVGLAGVVVNDSLVLIFQANQMHNKEGMGVQVAIRKAGPHRFRAILLTSVTTFAGLTPIILERSIQAQFLIPMAVSLGFGVMFATIITLILIPCGYLVLEDVHDAGSWLKRKLGLAGTSSSAPVDQAPH